MVSFGARRRTLLLAAVLHNPCWRADAGCSSTPNCLNMKGNVLNGGSGVHPENPPGARLVLANAHAEELRAALKPDILSPLKTDDTSHTSDPPGLGTAAAMKPHIVFVMADGEYVMPWLLSCLGCTIPCAAVNYIDRCDSC